MIRCSLPAFLLHQFQCVLSVHTSIDEGGTGQEDTASHTMLTVNQHTPSSLDTLMYPGGPLLQLLNRKRIGIGRGKMQQLNALFCHSTSIITILCTSIYHVRDARSR